MKSLILTVGLTDQFDEKWGVESPHKTEQMGSLYNLRMLDPDSVKETIQWRLNMDNPYVVKIINAWEKTIRKPHLKMMCHMHSEFDMDPSYYEMRRFMETIPLIPDSSENQLDMSIDLSQDCGMVSELPWGSIGVSANQILNYNNAKTILQDAGNRNPETQKPEDPSMDLIPDFPTDLEIPIMWTNDYALEAVSRKRDRRKGFTSIAEMHIDKAEYATRNLEALKEKGYTEQAIINIMAHQWINIGDLVTNPGEVYEKVSSLPYVCLVTLTEE